MAYYKVTMRHNSKTFEKLAHMQYDLFCKGNRYARTAISIVLILTGIANSGTWWGLLIIGYGWYLISSTYAQANHTARKLSKGITQAKMEFPASRYEFTDDGMQIYTLPEDKPFGDPLPYSEFYRMGEDAEYFYIFRDQHGGYMIPKNQLDDEQGFRGFLKRMTGKQPESKMPPYLKLVRKIQAKDNEPYHL